MRVAIYRVEAMVFCCARRSRPIRRLALRCVSVWTPLYMWNNAGLDVTTVRCQCFFLQTVLSYKWQVAQLSPRDRATRHAHVSWNHAKSHMFVELHLQHANDLQGHSRSWEMARIDRRGHSAIAELFVKFGTVKVPHCRLQSLISKVDYSR